MAENTTPSPQGSSPDKKQSSELLRSLERALKSQGDYNNLVKESIKDLEKSIKVYDKIGAKLSAINTSEINTKKLQSEIQRAQEKRYLNDKKIADLNESLNEKQKKEAQKYLGALETRTNKEKELIIAQREGNASMAAAAQKALAGIDKQIELKENLLNTEQLAYAQAVKQEELDTAGVKSLKEQLTIEEQISKQIGLTGGLATVLSKNLGIGTNVMSAMVEGSRNADGSLKKLSKFDTLKLGLSAIGKSVKENLNDPLVISAAIVKGISTGFKAANNAAKSVMSGTTGAMSSLSDSDTIQKMTSGVSGLLKNIPFVGGLLGGMVDSVSAFLDLTISASSKVQKMGRELGLSSQQALALNNSFNKFANSTNDALLNSQKLFETQIELGNQLGVLNTLSNDRLQTDIHLKEIAGLDLQTRGSLVESSVILGKNQKDIMNSVFAQVKGLKQATGIQLDQKGVLKEASNLGGYLGLSFAKYPAQLTKSLISIKAMGLELKQLDSMASSFLDFESSISNEFEAQLLTGKDINLTKARELFLNNDLAGAAQEITSQVGSSADFMKMNRIQAESLAKAMGMTRDQMGDMLKKQEYMSKIGAKDTDNAQKQYQLALAKYGTQKEMSAMLGEDTTNAIMNASAQEKIAGFMDKIKQGFVDLISNSGVSQFIDKAINWISKPENIQALINKIQGFFSTVLTVTGNVVGGIMKFLNYIPGVNIDEGLIDTVSNLGSSLSGATIGGGMNTFGAAPTVSENKAKSEAGKAQATPPQSQFAGGASPIVNLNVTNKLDPITGKSVVEVTDVSYSPNLDKTANHSNGH
jgi:hypothetical protein